MNFRNELRTRTQDTQLLEARKGVNILFIESQGATPATAGPGDACDSQDHGETSCMSSFSLPRVLQQSHVMAHFSVECPEDRDLHAKMEGRPATGLLLKSLSLRAPRFAGHG
eukprot:365178-Chlamydomonas_euryale.AAC.6